MTLSAWEGNWRDDMELAAKTLGYADVTLYASERPESTYGELATNLSVSIGRRFAPVQVQKVLRDAAISKMAVDEFAQTSLVRCLREIMPKGWNRGADPVFDYSHAAAVWINDLPKDYQERARSISRKLRKILNVDGWLPTDANDPFIVQAFRESNESAMHLPD